MIQLVEILVDCLDRDTKKSLHEIRRFAKIAQRGSYIRNKMHYPHDNDDAGLAFAARQQVFGELYARDALAADSPVLSIRTKLDDHPWCLDSVVVDKKEFDNEQSYQEYIIENPHIKDLLFW